jgi:hypothetical protein
MFQRNSVAASNRGSGSVPRSERMPYVLRRIESSPFRELLHDPSNVNA